VVDDVGGGVVGGDLSGGGHFVLSSSYAIRSANK